MRAPVGVQCERLTKAPPQLSQHRFRGRECLRELSWVPKGVGVQCECLIKAPAQVILHRLRS